VVTIKNEGLLWEVFLMSVEQNKTIIRCFLKKLDEGQDSIEEVCSPQFITHLPGCSEPTDRQGFKQFISLFYSAFPDLHHSVEDQVAEGNKVVSRLAVRGTQRGFFQGSAPSGKQVEFNDILITQLEGEKIVELWAQFDALGLFQKLGLSPSLKAGGSHSIPA
jgi:predicted ester cyclase